MSDTILIIGAGPGIGAATAGRFGREGWRVLLAARDVTKLNPLIDELRVGDVDAEARTVDAADPDAIRRLIADAAAEPAGLATVHYNAAVVRQGSVFDLSDDDVTGDLMVNVGGALAAVRAARAAFSARGGTVLLTGGGLALNPNPEAVTLGLGKAAIRHMTEALSDMLGAEAIHLATVTVNRIIKPGSADADGVADRFWALQAEPQPNWSWEASYP